MAMLYPKAEFYKSTSDGRWRWRLRARNGQIVSVTSETDGFPSKAKAVRSFKGVLANFSNHVTLEFLD